MSMIRISWRGLLLAAFLGAGACARELPGEAPPARSFYYPQDVAATPQGRYVYVLSSNFDQRFNAGWVSVVDVDAVLDAVDAERENPRAAVVHQLRVLSLGGELALAPDGKRGLITHRGVRRAQPLVTVFSASDAGSKLRCGDPNDNTGLNTADRRTDCDREHLLELDVDLERNVANPFSAVAWHWGGDADVPVAAVGMLGEPVMVVLGLAEPATQLGVLPVGQGGISSIAVHPDASGRYLAALSHLGGAQPQPSSIYSIELGVRAGEPDIAASRVARDALHQQTGGRDLADIAFAPDGQHAYVTNRYGDANDPQPGGVVATRSAFADVERSETQARARPVYEAVGSQPIAVEPAQLAYVPRPQGDLLAVASFTDDTVDVLAVEGGQLQPVARIDGVGAGPFAVEHVSRAGRQLLWVSNFIDHSLAVVDVSSESPGAFSVIARLTNPDLPPGDRIR